MYNIISKRNMIKWISELQYFLVITPRKEKLITSEKETITKVLEGIYLISWDNSKVLYRDSPLLYISKSYGRPKLIDVNELNMDKIQHSELPIDLRH